jgi:myosin-1
MRDSAVSMGSSGDGSGRDTPNSSVDGKGSGGVSLAGGLAEALRKRQASMQGRKGEEEGDDW